MEIQPIDNLNLCGRVKAGNLKPGTSPALPGLIRGLIPAHKSHFAPAIQRPIGSGNRNDWCIIQEPRIYIQVHVYTHHPCYYRKIIILINYCSTSYLFKKSKSKLYFCDRINRNKIQKIK